MAVHFPSQAARSRTRKSFGFQVQNSISQRLTSTFVPSLRTLYSICPRTSNLVTSSFQTQSEPILLGDLCFDELEVMRIETVDRNVREARGTVVFPEVFDGLELQTAENITVCLFELKVLNHLADADLESIQVNPTC